MPAHQRPDFSSEVVIGLIPGYQYSQFQRTDIQRLTTSSYTVSDQSDRMGFRLQGPALDCPRPGIISEGIAHGSVQIPGDGQPIVLLNDGQTIGGTPPSPAWCQRWIAAAWLSNYPVAVSGLNYAIWLRRRISVGFLSFTTRTLAGVRMARHLSGFNSPPGMLKIGNGLAKSAFFRIYGRPPTRLDITHAMARPASIR